MKLWMARHAPVEAPAGLCYGRTDLPADAAATREAADALAALLPGNVAVRCSPLRRCRGLAAALIERRPELAPCSFDALIAEMDFGDWEGQAWSAIPRTEFDAWTADFADAAAGGTGESTGLFMRRVAIAYDAWISEGRDALWVTHAGVIRAVWLLHAGTRRVTSAGEWPGTAIAPGECVSIEAPQWG